jgi:hypothetical protein
MLELLDLLERIWPKVATVFSPGALCRQAPVSELFFSPGHFYKMCIFNKLPEASGSFRCFVILRCGKLIAARLGNIALSEGQRVTKLGRSGLFRGGHVRVFSLLGQALRG